MTSPYAGLSAALARSGVSLRTVAITTAVLIALAVCLRVLLACGRFFLRYIVGVRV